MNYERKSEQSPPGFNGIPILGSMLSMVINDKHFLLTKLPSGSPNRIILSRETIINND